MSETALAAAYRATTNRLMAVTGAVWGARVYADYVPAGAVYPYLLFNWSGGGEANVVKARDANLMIMVQCIGDQLSACLTGAQQIADALNDHGLQDNASDHLNGGAFWYILSVTEEDTIHLTDLFAGAVPLYHCGARYRLVMEVI